MVSPNGKSKKPSDKGLDPDDDFDVVEELKQLQTVSDQEKLVIFDKTAKTLEGLKSKKVISDVPEFYKVIDSVYVVPPLDGLTQHELYYF